MDSWKGSAETLEIKRLVETHREKEMERTCSDSGDEGIGELGKASRDSGDEDGQLSATSFTQSKLRRTH